MITFLFSAYDGPGGNFEVNNSDGVTDVPAFNVTPDDSKDFSDSDSDIPTISTDGKEASVDIFTQLPSDEK